MSGRIVVGYTATDAGADALALGARLAAASDSVLDVVIVLPSDERSVITPPDAGYDRHLRETATGWLERAGESLQDAVTHRPHLRYAESFAEGLVAAADEFEATRWPMRMAPSTCWYPAPAMSLQAKWIGPTAERRSAP